MYGLIAREVTFHEDIVIKSAWPEPNPLYKIVPEYAR